MQFHPISDWNAAYANADHIADANGFVKKWPKEATAFRKQLASSGNATLDLSYGIADRNLIDIFYPEQESCGLLVFVHGGYWMRFSKDDWSHLAKGALANGWVVAMPSYTLCPEIGIAGITLEIARAIELLAAHIDGPIRLAGHSAGGHLVARMVCRKTPLKKKVQARIEHTLAISPVSDLRPLLGLKMNETLQLTEREATAESPALHFPRENTRVTCWVGAAERSEFIRQNLLLAAAWHGLGARISHIEEADRHHFDVIDGLTEPDSMITRQLLA